MIFARKGLAIFTNLFTFTLDRTKLPPSSFNKELSLSLIALPEEVPTKYIIKLTDSGIIFFMPLISSALKPSVTQTIVLLPEVFSKTEAAKVKASTGAEPPEGIISTSKDLNRFKMLPLSLVKGEIK